MSNRSIITLTLALLSGLSSLLVSTSASAVPAFARQTHMACASCHHQNFPTLNAFGRSFRAGGYTLNSGELVTGDDLSLPDDLHASVITKIRYQLSEGNDGGRGEIQWPDEAALLVGGRASEQVGFLLELGMGPQEGEGVGELVDTNGNGVIDIDDQTHVTSDVTGNYLSAKFHFNITDHVAVIPFSTDGLGVGYGYELMNTGAQRSQRPLENRSGYSAAQLLGTASGGATGIALGGYYDSFFFNYSHWAPTWGNVNASIAGGLAHYLRGGYFANMGDLEAGVGFSWMGGSIDTGPTDAELATVNVSSWTVDAQLQGDIGGLPTGIYASYGMAPKGTVDDPQFYNSSVDDDRTAMGLAGKLSLLPNKTHVYLGYSTLDDGVDDADADITVGVQHHVAQNIKLELYQVARNNDRDGYSMLMLFAGF